MTQMLSRGDVTECHGNPRRDHQMSPIVTECHHCPAAAAEARSLMVLYPISET